MIEKAGTDPKLQPGLLRPPYRRAAGKEICGLRSAVTTERLLEEMGGAEAAAKLRRKTLGYRKELERLKELLQTEREHIRKQADSLLDNANNIPAELRAWSNT
ncbi:hypothetical protein VQ056_21630 [Paenibacillus sp. JTLBN-2024]